MNIEQFNKNFPNYLPNDKTLIYCANPKCKYPNKTKDGRIETWIDYIKEQIEKYGDFICDKCVPLIKKSSFKVETSAEPIKNNVFE